MVDKNDPLLKELEDELRREQWAKLWDRYGIFAIAGAALIVALVGGFKLWESRQASLAEAGGAQYEAAVDLLHSAKTDQAQAALKEIAENGPQGYALLAELTLAGSHVKAGRPKDALAVYEEVAAQRSVDPLLADFASLQAAALRAGEADYAEMKGRLEPLAADGAPWRYNARELLGTAALKAGKLEEARQAFAPLLADANVPDGIRERVSNMMASIASAELAQAGTSPAGATPESPSPPPAQN